MWLFRLFCAEDKELGNSNYNKFCKYKQNEHAIINKTMLQSTIHLFFFDARLACSLKALRTFNHFNLLRIKRRNQWWCKNVSVTSLNAFKWSCSQLEFYSRIFYFGYPVLKL